MSPKVLGVLLVLGALTSFLYVIRSTPREATILLINGRVYTLDTENSVSEAIAIRGNRIVAVGSSNDLESRYSSERVIDLQDKVVLPGFIDAHGHMFGLGNFLQSVILVGVRSPDEVLRLVKERSTSAEPGDWIIGRGWDQNLWPDRQFPTASMLDPVSPNNPVVLIRVDGHAIWVNSRAMRLAGISRETKDPEGGRVIRDAQGNPTGVFIDKARYLVEKVRPPLTEADTVRGILTALEECARFGITEVHDMSLGRSQLVTYERLASEGKLPVRIYGVIHGGAPGWEKLLDHPPLIGAADGMLTIRAVKLYVDGALGSRGAALMEDYSDEPGNRGLVMMSEEELESSIRTIISRGYQPCIHAIGDRGNHMVLNAYERVLKTIPQGDYRPRIEHAQVIFPEDIPRFQELGVLPSMQPIHATSDMYWAEARLGRERVKGAYPWRSLLETGSIIVGGSDFPNDGMPPLWGFYASFTRSDRNGYPLDGWYSSERMTREEAARCFTEWAAFGSFEEKRKGTIEVGKWADFTVLSKDIMQVPPSEVLTTEVEMTIVGGRIIYQKNSDSSVVP